MPFKGAPDTAARVVSLFPAIAHGDAEHRAWLERAIEDHFAGRPVERPPMSPTMADQWRDISSAPKDGTPVLLGWGNRVLWGMWAENPAAGPIGWYAWNPPFEICPVSYMTHWQPQPEPPTASHRPGAQPVGDDHG